jgi:predicted dienelactone hydrolase
LRWAAWYPAPDDAIEQEAPARLAAISFFALGSAAREGDLSDAQRRYPVVLLSHGTGGAASGLDWLARRLALRGFIALAVNHHGNTAAAERYRPEGFLAQWERPRDLSLLLDHIETHPAFAGRLDLDRVFAGGFSAGAYTAAAALGAITLFSQYRPPAGDASGANAAPAALTNGPREFPDLADHLPRLLAESAVFRASWARMSADYHDPRIKAALLCAPGRSVRGFSPESLAAIATPVTIATGGADEVGPPAECTFWLQRQLPHASAEIVHPDAGHYVFLPEATATGRRMAPDICVDPPTVDRHTIHERAAAIALDLFASV